jgi:ankyrin repeat protein
VEANKIEVTKILLEQVKEDQEKKLLLLAHKNSEGKTPWEIAYQNKNREICQVLKDNGDPNAASASCCIS